MARMWRVAAIISATGSNYTRLGCDILGFCETVGQLDVRIKHRL